MNKLNNLITAPLKIWLVQTGTPLHKALTDNTDTFLLVKQPADADCILFEKDAPNYIRQAEEFKNWPEKCVVVSETDLPTYFLPACYASNKKGLLSRGRAQTIPYIMSARVVPNPFIQTAGSGTEQPVYLYAFRGGSTSWVRKKLFKHKPAGADVLVEESNHYHHWAYEDAYMDKKSALQKQYAKLLNQSVFFLCPRGVGSGSIRMFEVVQAGKIPVIISDKWIPVEGIPWDEFSLRIPESKITEIDSIIRKNAPRAKTLAENTRKAWDEYFSPGKDLQLLALALIRIQARRNERVEKMIRALFPLQEYRNRLWERFRKAAKFLILKCYVLMGKEFPYSLNRPASEQLGNKKKG